MSNEPSRTLSGQLRQHLAALKAAGIEFLPRSAPLPMPPLPAVVPETPAVVPPAQASVRETPPTSVPVAPPASLFAAPAETVPATVEECRHELHVLAQRVAPCSRCPELFSTRTQTVFGVGKLEPDIAFVGEAPGADEDAQGEPFVGAAGKLLDKIIAACGYRREDVYICNILKCRPPRNRTPLPDECANCRDYLERQLALVKPKYLVALGGVAAQNLLQTKIGIMKLRGRFYDYKGIPLLCTFHPAALLRNESWKKDCWDDMKMLLKKMGKPIPR